MTIAAALLAVAIVGIRIMMQEPGDVQHEPGQVIASGPINPEGQAPNGVEAETPQHVPREVVDKSFEGRFRKELEFVLTEDPLYVDYVASGVQKGEEARGDWRSSQLAEMIQYVRDGGTEIAPPDREMLQALDGYAMRYASSLLRSHAQNCSDDTNATTLTLEKRLAGTDMSFAIHNAPEAIAEYCRGGQINFRSSENMEMAERLAEIRDNYVVEYAKISEELQVLEWAMAVAMKRAGYEGSPTEAREIAMDWVPRLTELREAQAVVGNSYYAAIKSEVLQRFPDENQ